MYKVNVYITLKESVLDPQGSTVKESLHHLSYHQVESVRIGKFIEIMIEKTDTPVEETIKEICDKLLANVVIEDYRFDIEEV